MRNHTLPDVQGGMAAETVSLDKVGVCNVLMPVAVHTVKGSDVRVTAKVSAYCSLNESQRGAHMSRFPLTILDTLREHSVASDFLNQVPCRLRDSQGAEDAYIKLRFPYELDNISPVSGFNGPVFADVVLESSVKGSDPVRKFITVTHQVIAVCPCSKELSIAAWDDLGEHGAPHMQRSYVSVTAEFDDPLIWVEDLISVIEEAAPSPHFIVKRPDEQAMALTAWKNTNFVEDINRTIAQQLEPRTDIIDYVIVVRNEETIHPFDVVAVRCKGLPGGLR